MKTVLSIISNKDLYKLSEGKAFIKWLKNKFTDTLVKIDLDAEYKLFLKSHPEYK
jgi:hypothetical protein